MAVTLARASWAYRGTRITGRRDRGDKRQG